MQFLLPIILVALSGGLFLTWIDPTYNNIKDLQSEKDQYDEILEKSLEVKKFREEIQAKYNTIDTTDFDRLESLLPSHIDNIQLILDMNSIADRRGLFIDDIRIERDENTSGRESLDTGSGPGSYDTVSFSFSVVSSYDLFKEFLDDLARSLRVIDVQSVSVGTIADEDQFFRFDVGIQTYWLKQ